MLRPSLPASIEIETNIDVKCGLVYDDPTNIHQIIVNLCTNASHAMGKKKGRLVVTVSHLEQNTKQSSPKMPTQPDSFVVLTVEDSGKGMDEKTRTRIFEPYYTTKSLGEGTGLGLAVIHGIVENCNGFIEVESTSSAGTVVRVYFPAIKEGHGIISGTKKHLSPPTGKENILVIDDEPALTAIIKAILTRLGYHVETTTRSIDALEKFKASPQSFDLIITADMVN